MKSQEVHYLISFFLLGAYFDLQNEEDEEIKLDKSQIATANANEIDKNILGRETKQLLIKFAQQQ